MAIESRNILKTYFETGDIPTEDQFGDLIDSSPNLEDDGIYVFEEPVTLEKRFGVGVQQPTYTLGVKPQGTNEGLISLHNLSDDQPAWLINMLPDGAVDKGFNIEQQTAIGAETRLFINSVNGNVGLGTLTPSEKLHLEQSSAGSTAGARLINLATTANQGWTVGHLQDPLAGRDGGLVFVENGPDEERMILSEAGKLGVNESSPDTYLHVGCDTSSPEAVVSLAEGTGVASVGPITDNLVFDFQSIQSRSGQFIGPTLDLEVAPLGLQPLGGDVKLHGDPSADPATLVLFTNEGFVGIGNDTPVERIDVAGAIKIGANDADMEGTIRWDGADFEGRTASGWISLTAGAGKWTDGTGDAIYYDDGTAPRVGIGTDAPVGTLHVSDTESVGEGNTAAIISNTSVTTSTGQDDNRISLLLSNTGNWGGDPLSKAVGLYVPEVTGQASAESNVAAAMNGNVVIGDLISGTTVVGRNAEKVLAIQNGVAPLAAANSVSVQVYAADLNGTSTLHVLRGNDETIALYRETALTPADTTPFPVNYDATTIAILENMQLRINELEAKLQAIGMLA